MHSGNKIRKFQIGGYLQPANVYNAIQSGAASAAVLGSVGKVVDKVFPKWLLNTMTYLSPLNYLAALSHGSIDPRVGEEEIATWHPTLQLLGRTGEIVTGPKVVKTVGKGIKGTGNLVVDVSAQYGNKPARGLAISREIDKGVSLATQNGRIEVTDNYFNAPDKWYRVSERPEKTGIEEQGKNVTTFDDPGINGTSNGWRISMLNLNGRMIPGKGVNEGYFMFLPRKINLSKDGAAHGNTSQAAKGLIWRGTFAFSKIFPIGVIEGLAPVKIFRGMNSLGKDSRTNFVLLNWEDVPLGARVGFHTGEMPMSNLGWFLKLPNGRYTYEPIIPEKRWVVDHGADFRKKGGKLCLVPRKK